MQVPEVNYNCRLRTEPVSASGRNRGEADIGLLVACKVQLSSEVIRWKTESLRLQKECDSAHHHSKELDQTISKLRERTRDLETRLTQAEEENKHLKTRSVLVDDEKASNIQRLTQSLNKYHSFPTAGLAVNPAMSRLSRLIPQDLQGHTEAPQEDWREVSQKMLKQMQQEMKELQEMNSCLESHNDQSGARDVHPDSDCREELEESISTLVSDTKSLKHHLLDQRKKLHLLIKNISQGDVCHKESVCVRRKTRDSLLINSSSTSTNKVQGVSHNTFHDDFTEQLEGLPTLQMVRETDAWNVDEDLTLHPCSCSEEQTTNSRLVEEQKAEVIEDRVCPICQRPFDTTVPQAEFEEHVFNHLEAESESLLEQYVVL